MIFFLSWIFFPEDLPRFHPEFWLELNPFYLQSFSQTFSKYIFQASRFLLGCHPQIFREYLLDFLVFLFNDSVGMFTRVSSKISLGIVFPSFFFRWWGCPWNYSQKFSCDASEFLTPAVSSSQRFSLDSSRSSSQILFQRLPRDCFQP